MVDGSGTAAPSVTLNVATGLPVAVGSTLTTLPDTDAKVPVVNGVRLKKKKSDGKPTVRRSGRVAALNMATPKSVCVGVIWSPITDRPGSNPGVSKVRDVTRGAVTGMTTNPPGDSRPGTVSSISNALTAPFAGKLKSYIASALATLAHDRMTRRTTPSVRFFT